jgi:protein-L-isoaspartate(D-aspartate) O-methyltransferase
MRTSAPGVGQRRRRITDRDGADGTGAVGPGADDRQGVQTGARPDIALCWRLGHLEGAMSRQREHAEELRGFHARLMAAASRSSDPRIERIFELVPREAFLPPGPWKVMVGERYFQTPSADPAYVYQNNLVALDAEKGINNGEPYLHAAWIGAIAPQSGESVTHIGAGTGYYSAILSMLVLPGGRVDAIEIDERLAVSARNNLAPFENVTVISGNGVELPLQRSDVIYVNAGVAAPPAQWLQALRPGGRLLFPWRPSQTVALAALVTRAAAGFNLKPLMPAWFIPCVGASEAPVGSTPPNRDQAWRSRSIRLTSQQAPDDTATAVYQDIWFSSAALA